MPQRRESISTANRSLYSLMKINFRYYISVINICSSHPLTAFILAFFRKRRKFPRISAGMVGIRMSKQTKKMVWNYFPVRRIQRNVGISKKRRSSVLRPQGAARPHSAAPAWRRCGPLCGPFVRAVVRAAHREFRSVYQNKARGFASVTS